MKQLYNEKNMKVSEVSSNNDNLDIDLNWCYHISFGEIPYRIDMLAKKVGDDILVNIIGGTKPHIGAVALAQYHPSMRDVTASSASTSLMVIPPHKEGEVAMRVSDELARACKTNVITTVGVHIDDASTSEIEQLIDNMWEALCQLKSQLLDKQ
jgi:hypothetical protein